MDHDQGGKIKGLLSWKGYGEVSVRGSAGETLLVCQHEAVYRVI